MLRDRTQNRTDGPTLGMDHFIFEGGGDNFVLLRILFSPLGYARIIFGTLRLCTNFFSRQFSVFVFIKVSPKMSIIRYASTSTYMYLKHCFLFRLIKKSTLTETQYVRPGKPF